MGRDRTEAGEEGETAAVHDRGVLPQHCTTKHARKQSMFLVASALRGIPADVRFIVILGEGEQADNG
jgi:hypothetical protein